MQNDWLWGGNKIIQREKHGDSMKFTDLSVMATSPEFFSKNLTKFPWRITRSSFQRLSVGELKFQEFSRTTRIPGSCRNHVEVKDFIGYVFWEGKKKVIFVLRGGGGGGYM